MRTFTIIALATLLAAPATAQAQSSAQPAVMASLLQQINSAEEKLVGLAEAIPDDRYGWRPGEGVRSVSEVILHIAADNYFLPTIVGVAAPAATGIQTGDYPSVQKYEGRTATKAEAVSDLRASFAHVRQVMEGVDGAALAQSHNVFGSQMTGLDVWVLTTTHLHEHLGQMIAYARSNDIVPPWSRRN